MSASFNIPDGSNTLRLPGVDETSRANGYRWGGVQADFVDEGSTETPKFPRLKATDFAAEKIIGYVPADQRTHGRRPKPWRVLSPSR